MSPVAPTRRSLLKLAAIAPAFALPAPSPALALARLGPTLGRQAPGFYRFTLGQARITILSDGHFTIPVSQLGVNADPGEVMAFLQAHYLSSQSAYRHTNLLFVELGAAKLLVDVGAGSRLVATTGQLMNNLAAAGIDPASITNVVITHAHPDHIWGMRDDFDEPIFPAAKYSIAAAEMDYWLQDDLVNKVRPAQQQTVLGAVNSITIDGVEWNRLVAGDEVVPGVRVMATPGHTPGHISLHVQSNGQRLIALGDSITNAYMDLAHPDWVIRRDMDPDTTVKTRRRLLDMAAAGRIAVLGYHFAFPGVGHVMRDNGNYRFIPALWQWQG